MRSPCLLFTCLTLALLAAGGCRQERSRIMSDDEQQEAMEGPRDYREMLNRARAKQSEADIRTELEQGVARFRHARSRLPTNLYELLSSGIMTRMPEPPPGQVYTYDPVHGNVGLAATPDDTGLALPAGITNETPAHLQNVPLPAMP